MKQKKTKDIKLVGNFYIYFFLESEERRKQKKEKMENTNEKMDKFPDINTNQNDVVPTQNINTTTTNPTSVITMEQNTKILKYRESTIAAAEYSHEATSSATNDEFENSAGIFHNSSWKSEMNVSEGAGNNSTGQITNVLDSNNRCNMKMQHRNNCKRFNRSNSNYSSKSGKNQNNRVKKRTRRGKSKRQPNKPYQKTGFKFLRPKSCPNSDNRRLNLFTNQPLVPYNTNKFLMEFHAVEIPSLSPGRTRNSSLSIESDDNYFYSLPEDEMEFLTKEFSSVYENARCETLNTMDKNQLIQQYLQLEAKLEQTNRRAEAKDEKLKNLEDAIKNLTAENSGKFCHLF